MYDLADLLRDIKGIVWIIAGMWWIWLFILGTGFWIYLGNI